MDAILLDLVDRANFKGLRMGVTLNVDGVLVTGTIIGVEEYFQLMGEIHQSAEYWTEWGARTLEELRPSSEEVLPPSEDDMEPPKSPVFLHLRDAKYVLGGARFVPTDRGLLWRGSIRSVSGYSIGRLSVKGDTAS